MSVLIKGMEMPKNGWKHIMLTSDGKAYRFGDFTADNTATRYEAVEVPPHGDLVDINALKFAILDGDYVNEHDYLKGVLNAINHATTVIESDKDGET